jgi:hypothetical protein
MGVECLEDPYLNTECYSGYMDVAGSDQSKIVLGVVGR